VARAWGRGGGVVGHLGSAGCPLLGTVRRRITYLVHIGISNTMSHCTQNLLQKNHGGNLQA
jgi:hypothetical protein